VIDTGKTVAIVQSNYVPWKGYFDVIDRVDEFILLDDVQYTRRDWRNRNRIKTAAGLLWLTIPVAHDKAAPRIDEMHASDSGWQREHWTTLTHHYARAQHFRDQRDRFEELYLDSDETRLSDINRRFISAICALLGIDTPIHRSSEYAAPGTSSERLVNICRAAGARRYLSGPRAQAYLDESLFSAAGIEVAWMDYSGYPEYPQLNPPFEHRVSVLDLIFNTGPAAHRYIRGGAAVA
jgi:hypothetical protein